jgi:hypothetical protein
MRASSMAALRRAQWTTSRSAAQDGCFASNRASSSPGRSRVHHFRQFHATCGLRGSGPVWLEAVSFQDFRGRSRLACNCLKIVVSPVRVRVSPSKCPESCTVSGFSSCGCDGHELGSPGTRNGRGASGSSHGPRPRRKRLQTLRLSPPGKPMSRIGRKRPIGLSGLFRLRSRSDAVRVPAIPVIRGRARRQCRRLQRRC